MPLRKSLSLFTNNFKGDSVKNRLFIVSGSPLEFNMVFPGCDNGATQKAHAS